MVPAALPAFSAPIGVRVVPSWLISDWDRLCAATALATRLRARPQAPMNVFCICILFSPKTGLEAYAEADSGEVAVNQGVVLAIKEVGVTDAGVVLVGVIGVQTDADRLGIFVEVGAVTLNVMGPGDVRAQVDTGDHVAVIQGRTQAVAPGEVGEEPVVLTPGGAVGVIRCVRRAGTIGCATLAKQGIAAKLGLAIAAADAADIVSTHLAYQCETACAEYAVNEVHRTHGGLPELLALITLDIIAWSPRIALVSRVTQSQSTRERRATQVTGIDLDWHIWTVTELAGHGHAADIGTEADAVKTNIFRMLKEVATQTFSAINPYRDRLLQHTNPTFDIGIYRVAAMVVHSIEAELSVVQCGCKPTQSDTKLTTVTSLLIFTYSYNIVRVCTQLRMLEAVQSALICIANPQQSVVTATSRHICTGKESTAVICYGAMPFELVEGFHAQVFGQSLREIQHLNRHQSFLQLCARTAESGGVDRVDGVDAVLDEDTLTPADHLAAQTDVTGILADEIVVIDKGVQQLNTGALLQRVTA